MAIAASGHSQEGSKPDSPERRYSYGKPSNTPQKHPAPHDRRLDHRAKQVDCVLTFGYVRGIPPTGAQGELEKCNDLLDPNWSIPMQEAELR